jgi:hypothetical protein
MLLSRNIPEQTHALLRPGVEHLPNPRMRDGRVGLLIIGVRRDHIDGRAHSAQPRFEDRPVVVEIDAVRACVDPVWHLAARFFALRISMQNTR